MSWYVENLLRSAKSIRDSIMVSENNITDTNMGSDLYLDLLSIEKTLNDLYEKKLIKFFDKKIVTMLSNGDSIEDVAEKLGVARPTITKRFSTVCDRVAFILGDNFSDVGYINYMKEKYNLNEEQINKALEYMRSSVRRIVVNHR